MNNFNMDYVLEVAEKILNVKSPTGYTNEVVETLETLVSDLGYTSERDQKGNLIVTIDGEDDSYTRGVSRSC